MAWPGYTRTLSKWLGFVVAIWVQSISGNNYTFANYSADLKRVMNYTQTELNGLGVAKDVGKSVGLLAGYLSNFLPPQVILMTGAIVGALGYGTTWLVVSERIAPPAFWQMCIAVFLGGNSTTWMNTAVLVTCMRNFAKSRGIVSGILKGIVGLSTAIFTVLCASLFTGDSSAFLLLLTFLPFGVCLVASVFLRELPFSSEDDADEPTSFSILNVISLILSLYLLSYSFFGNSLSPLFSNLFAIGLLVILFSPIVVPARTTLMEWLGKSADPKKVDEGKRPLLRNDDTERNEAIDEEEVVVPTEKPAVSLGDGAGGSGGLAENSKPKLGDNYTTLQILLSMDFWILFVNFLTTIGTGMAVINNMGQMGEALGYPDVANFVSFFSIFGFFGRIGAGAVSERYVRSSALPRPVWMAGAKVLTIVAYLGLAWGITGSLHFGSIVVGFCYGVQMTIVVATSSEMFGLKSFGMTYNLLILNIPLGSFLFSGLLAGYLFDKEAEVAIYPHRSLLTKLISSLSDEANKCYGAHCFRTLFIIMAGAMALGLGLDLFLILRLRPVYQKLYGSRLASSRSAVSTGRR